MVNANRARTRNGLWLAGVLLVGLLALPAIAVAAGDEHPKAKEERPKEVPYDTPGEIPLLSPDYRQTSHKVVLITDDSLSPQTVILKQGQLVAWISYSKNSAVIVFEREVARSMICHSLVNFSIKEDELRSEPIQPGEFASFCELKPGKYNYIVVRPSMDTEGHMKSRNRLRGEIVVKESS